MKRMAPGTRKPQRRSSEQPRRYPTADDTVIAQKLREAFPDSVFVGIFSNVCFVFGVFDKQHPAVKRGEYGYVACVRRYRSNKTGREHIRYESSWMLDPNECLIMARGFARIARTIPVKLQ